MTGFYEYIEEDWSYLSWKANLLSPSALPEGIAAFQASGKHVSNADPAYQTCPVSHAKQPLLWVPACAGGAA